MTGNNNPTLQIYPWFKNHPVSSSILMMLVFIMLFSFIIDISYSRFQTVVDLMRPENGVDITAYAIFVLLFSGVEKSLGSFNYAMWMIWSAVYLLCIRNLQNSHSKGPSFLIICPFFTFIYMHTPDYYFKIKSLKFSDKILYIIAVFQFVFFEYPDGLMDFGVCLVSNLIWHVVMFIARKRRPANQTHPQNQTQQRNAEDINELPMDNLQPLDPHDTE